MFFVGSPARYTEGDVEKDTHWDHLVEKHNKLQPTKDRIKVAAAGQTEIDGYPAKKKGA